MKPFWTAARKKEVEHTLLVYQNAMHLHTWSIKCEFLDKDSDGDDEEVAFVNTHSRYKTATISVRPSIYDKDQGLEATLVHELVHVVLSPMHELLIDASHQKVVTQEQISYFNELVTTDVTNIIRSIRNA